MLARHLRPVRRPVDDTLFMRRLRGGGWRHFCSLPCLRHLLLVRLRLRLRLRLLHEWMPLRRGGELRPR